MWDSVSQRTEDHTKLGTSAVASKVKIRSNFRRVCTQIHIYIFSFSFSGNLKISRTIYDWPHGMFRQYMYDFLQHHFREITHILFFCGYNEKSECGRIYCIPVTSLYFAMRKHIQLHAINIAIVLLCFATQTSHLSFIYICVWKYDVVLAGLLFTGRIYPANLWPQLKEDWYD